MRRPNHPRVRIYETIRSAHLERAHELTPATIIYRNRRYDFDSSLADGLDLIHASAWWTALLLLASPVDGMEVNEPMMRPGALRSSVAIAAVRAGSLFRRQPVPIVSYAIENGDPWLASDRRLRARARAARDRALSWWIGWQLDRLAFGTAGAQAAYQRHRIPSDSHAVSTVIPALPCPCPCLKDATGERDPTQVVFVGALVPRKGFPLILAAWPTVRSLIPGATLMIVGTGQFTAEAQTAAESDPSISFLQDPPRAQVHASLRKSAVLILPSQPADGWREQVGLPIVEGLAHGCRIVATTETGLASWLDAHDHAVVPTPTDSGLVSEAIVSMLRSTKSADDVIADLPDVDGRLAADRWLFNE